MAQGLVGPSDSDANFRNDEQGLFPPLVDLTVRACNPDFKGRGLAISEGHIDRFVCRITSKLELVLFKCSIDSLRRVSRCWVA